MRRFFLICIVFAAGCQPRDPLDWKISARTPTDFDRWSDKTMILLPEDLAKELTHSFNIIAASTPTARVTNEEVAYQDAKNPVCRQLHHRTIRGAIIAGCLENNVTLMRKINLELDVIAKLTIRLNELESWTTEYGRIERSIKYRHQVVAAAETQVENNRRRIAELERKTP